jgi:hypothetical protein
MNQDGAEWIGMREFQAAVARNPKKVLDEARFFLTRGLAVYKAGIIRAPWRIGNRGGGAPVRSGNLRDTHLTQIRGLEGTIGPNLEAAPYGKFVHQGTRLMQGRPWLEYVKSTKQGEIESLYRGMLKEIVSDLAK